ncbi:hypothetical protein BST61_g4793 [Cercospora zeina]
MKDYRVPTPTYMSTEQMSMSSSLLSLPHTPPRPSRLRECITIEHRDADLPQRTASYLKDLRKPLSRPSGSRPAPPSKFGSVRRTATPSAADVVDNNETSVDDDRPPLLTSNSMPIMQPPQKLSHGSTESTLSQRSMSRSPFAGRPLARAPTVTPDPSPQDTDRPQQRRTPSIKYMENGLRWMEKQEIRSLRQALDDMDLDEERKVHLSAQEEAAELVWKHQNPEAAGGPFINPDLKRDYKSHLRKGSYHRSLSQDAFTSAGSRSASEGSQASVADEIIGHPKGLRTAPGPRRVSPPTGEVSVQKRRVSSGKSYDRNQLAEVVAKDIAVAHRRVSSGSKRIMSGEKKKFMDPNDRIWEDPEEGESPQKQQNTLQSMAKDKRSSATSPVPSYVRKNPFARVRAQYEKNLERSNSAPTLQTLGSAPVPRHDRIEIQRNPPSQSRNAFYTSNEVVLPPTPPTELPHEADEVAPKGSPTKEGKEIRSGDIRAATSKSRSAYSPNLPRPTMVSDKPGRPIVSFEKDYKPKEIVMEEQHVDALPGACNNSDPVQKGNFEPTTKSVPSQYRNSPFARNSAGDHWQRSSQASRLPARSTDAPPIPTICAPDDPHVPTINIDPETPSINARESPSNSPTRSSRMPPKAGEAMGSNRPPPRHANTMPIGRNKSSPHYTPSTRQSGALCAHCALPIAGRILSAAGERFHPGCFVCHQCTTNLELVAFYPEPEKQRSARLEDADSQDAEATLRFYCHLDFHELFSPRCKSCKTPIEGEVIVACGAEWHVGHFFCAQCGDPFDSSMPFVEKDGYAWCVGCHTNRYSSKCRKCRKPVTEVVVKALGSDWHSNCFTCMECHGEFEDGRYFLRGDSQDPVCVKCEQRRLKA